jgi:hypothetical protein
MKEEVSKTVTKGRSEREKMNGGKKKASEGRNEWIEIGIE